MEDIINKYPDDIVEIFEKLDNGDFDKIDWFDLDSFFANEFPNLDNEELEILTYRFENRFIKLNKKIITGYDQDVINLSVLKKLCDNYSKEVPRTLLANDTYEVNATKTSAIVDKSLNLFEFYGVADKIKQGEMNQSFYKIDLNKWYKKSKYHIQDYNLLSSISPVITSFLNIGFIKTFNIQNLFVKLSEVIEYAIRPSLYHNKMIHIEDEILMAMDEKRTFTFTYIDNHNQIQEFEGVPLKIVYKLNEKFVVIKDSSNGEIFEIALFDLRFTKEESTYLKKPKELKNISTLSINQPIKIQEESKNIEVILECDSLVYEYFKMKPLSNMTIYDEKEKLKEFSQKYNIEGLKNKFYVVANDSEDMVISTVLHTLNNVKILSPNNLNDKLASMFENYLSKTNIDICKDNNPPSPSDTDFESKKVPKGVSEEEIKNNRVIKDNDININQ